MAPAVPIPDDTPDELLRRLVTSAPLGFYAGALRDGSSDTLAANGFLRVMFGYGSNAPLADVRPFDPGRFADTVSRAALIERLGRDGAVRDLLLRVRRTDGTLFWIEVTGHGDPDAGFGRRHVHGDGARRHRAETARRSDARPPPATPAGREAGGPRSDDLGRGARAEQPAGHHPHLGGTAGRQADGSGAAAGLRSHPQRGRTGRARSSGTC